MPISEAPSSSFDAVQEKAGLSEHEGVVMRLLELAAPTVEGATVLAKRLRTLEGVVLHSLLKMPPMVQRNRRYFAMLDSLAAGGEGVEIPGLTATDRAELREALDGDMYKKAAVVLLALNDTLMEDTSTWLTVTWKTLQIEHVLPQTLDGDSEWTLHFRPKEREAWTNKLGNLTLMTGKLNASLGNKPFKVKRADMTKAIFPLTREAFEHPEWMPEVVAKQHKRLLWLANKRWGPGLNEP